LADGFFASNRMAAFIFSVTPSESWGLFVMACARRTRPQLSLGDGLFGG
jgi:hypothetical protein